MSVDDAIYFFENQRIDVLCDALNVA